MRAFRTVTLLTAGSRLPNAPPLSSRPTRSVVIEKRFLMKRAKRETEENKEEAKSEKAHKALKKDTQRTASASKGKGKGEASTHEHEEHVETIERGHVYFFYRPRVETEHAHSFKDVQRLYIALSPDGKQSECRLLIVPKKKMPSTNKKERSFALVDEAGKIDDIVEALRETTYQTKTRGERHQGAARLIGRGVYLIAKHHIPRKTKDTEGEHTHFCYVLTNPDKPHHLQKDFNIQDEDDFIISIKNPEKRSTTFTSKHPELPENLKELFVDYSFIPLENPAILDYAGIELLLVGASHDVEHLGQDVVKMEKQADKEHKTTHAAVKKELHLAKTHVGLSLHPMEGKWE